MKRSILPILCAIAVLRLSAADVVAPTLGIGATAPDFSLPGTDGKTYTLKDFASAKFFVLIFNSNHCPTAQAYEERMKKLVTDYKDKGVTLIAVNPNNNDGLRADELGYTDLDDSMNAMKIRAKHKEFNFAYLDDGPTQVVAKAYGCKVTPHAFLFDAERKLRYVGRIDDNEREELAKTFDLRVALDELIAGKEVTVKETRAFGCSTKWLEKAEGVKKWKEKVAAEPVTVELVDEAGLTALRKGAGDKLRLVNFWSTTCGPCVAEMGELVEINLTFRNRAFELITVSTNFPDEKADVEMLLKKKHMSAKNLLFAGTDKYKHMAAFDKDWDATIPFTMLIGKSGEVLYKTNEAIDALALKRAIVAALGRHIDPPKKK